MRQVITVFAVLLGLVAQSSAETPEFPYQAVVDSNEVYVRSGPGERYYPTSRLHHGQPVEIHRHDPGGWYMIAPPEGSFSWVPTKYVRAGSDGIGELIENHVVAYVGSEFGDECGVFQRRLSMGETVAILDKKTISTERGPEAMYRIKSPRREWRWIPGNAVVPDAGLAARGTTPDRAIRPKQESPGASRRDVASRDAAAGSGLLFGDRKGVESRMTSRTETHEDRPRESLTNVSANQGESDRQQLQADRQRLEQLDARFKMIVQQEMSEWRLDGLQDEYHQLQSGDVHPALANQIDLRLAAIERYDRIKSEFDGFVELTNQTSQRDAELLKYSRSSTSPSPTERSANDNLVPFPADDARSESRRQTSSSVVDVPEFEDSELAPAMDPPERSQPTYSRSDVAQVQSTFPPIEQRPAYGTSSPPTGNGSLVPNPQRLQQPALAPTPQRPAPLRQPPPVDMRSRFVGAGVVQKSVSVPGVPEYVLLTPQGKILAYLSGESGVDLAASIGKSMGLEGERKFDDRLSADLIKVRNLVPVRLQSR